MYTTREQTVSRLLHACSTACILYVHYTWQPHSSLWVYQRHVNHLHFKLLSSGNWQSGVTYIITAIVTGWGWVGGGVNLSTLNTARLKLQTPVTRSGCSVANLGVVEVGWGVNLSTLNTARLKLQTPVTRSGCSVANLGVVEVGWGGELINSEHCQIKTANTCNQKWLLSSQLGCGGGGVGGWTYQLWTLPD